MIIAKHLDNVPPLENSHIPWCLVSLARAIWRFGGRFRPLGGFCPPWHFPTMAKEIEQLLALGLSERTLKRNLSPRGAELVELLGVEAAIKLMHRFSGQSVKVPRTVSEDRLIVKLLGFKAAGDLVEAYGGIELEIPTGLTGLRTLTRLKGVKLLDDGVSARAVCKQLKVSLSAVKRWKHRYCEVSE